VGDVSALLVELYPRLVEQARDLAQGARLPNVEVALGDASLTTVLADAVPADVLLICGVFGNVSGNYSGLLKVASTT
jgi:protein-L-isoaspartate O-methyltransferase